MKIFIITTLFISTLLCTTSSASPTDSLTCFTPAQVRNITAALLELDYRRRAMPLQDSIITTQEEIIDFQSTHIRGILSENATLRHDLTQQKKRTLWGTLTGFGLGLVVGLLLL